jgi:hypothetical protein
MTKKERRKNALQLLAIRWGLITFIALLTISGIYHFDKFQATRVVGPLVELSLLNDEIRYYIDLESTLQGYKDNTEYSNKIRELNAERRDNFYNSDDEVISFVSRSFALFKIFYFLCALALMIVVTIFPLMILYGFYWNSFKRFRRTWKRINQSKRKNGNGTKIARLSDYRRFEAGIENIQ